MESSWRWNVAELGMVSNLTLLAARLLLPFGGYDYVIKRYESQTVAVLATPADFGDVYNWQFTIINTGVKTFPYGFPVEPDHP